MAGTLRRQESEGASGPLFPWLTWEVALYALILALAVVLRLGWLEMRIMDVPEADQAWQAWRVANGQTPTGGPGSYSPLLLSGQALLFALFGASDAAARLLPALVGSALVALPYLLRRSIGRLGALAAALALAVSPSLVYSARFGNGVSLLLFAVLGLVVLWQAYRQTQHRAYLNVMPVLAACALLADPRVLGVLLVLVFAWAVERFLFRRGSYGRDPFLSSSDVASDREPVPWRQVGLTFGVAFVLGATTFAFNPGGLGAWADYAAAWARHLMPVVNGQPWYYPLLALVLYEPFLLLFGCIGAVSLFTRKSDGLERDSVAVFVWLAVGFALLAIFSGGRNAGDVALICAPLAILAGRASERLASSWQADAPAALLDAAGVRLEWRDRQYGKSWARDGILVLILLLIVAYVGLQASFYARALYINRQQSEQFLWFWLLAVALLVLLVGFSLAWLGGRVTWRAAGTVLAVVLLLTCFSGAVGLNFRRANDPRELHVLLASDRGTRDVLEVMADFSYNRRGAPNAIPVVVEESLGPMWPWYLRDWEDVTFVGELSGDSGFGSDSAPGSERTAPLVLSSTDRADPAEGGGWNPAERYLGTDFVIRTWWQPSELVSNDPLSWWLYRKSISRPIPVQRVVLWVQADENQE